MSHQWECLPAHSVNHSAVTMQAFIYRTWMSDPGACEDGVRVCVCVCVFVRLCFCCTLEQYGEREEGSDLLCSLRVGLPPGVPLLCIVRRGVGKGHGGHVVGLQLVPVGPRRPSSAVSSSIRICRGPISTGQRTVLSHKKLVTTSYRSSLRPSG